MGTDADAYGRTAERVGTSVLTATLVVLMGFRFYVAWNVPAIWTWDDVNYRQAAVQAYAADTGVGGALATVVAPRVGLLDGRRTAGYHDWLTLGLSIGIPLVDRDRVPFFVASERIFQMVNAIAFALQTVLVYVGFRWGGARRLAVAAACLYASTPLVLGISRWVLTESHVMTALLAFSVLGTLLVGAAPASRRSEVLRAAAVGVAFGVLSSTREYVAPSVLLLPAGVIAALLVSRRRVAALSFGAAVAPYYAAACFNLSVSLPRMLETAGDPRYFHPILEVIGHSIRHVVGPPQSILLAVAAAGIAWGAWRLVRNRRLESHDRGAALFFAAHLVLLAVYVIAIVAAQNRAARNVLPIVWTLFGALVSGVRLFRLGETQTVRVVARWASVPLVAASVLLAGHDLFVAYDGGASFAHHAYRLEVYNHPLVLRRLRWPGDMHVAEGDGGSAASAPPGN